jgi:polysaccharide biosynthesis PFTS motif protein
MDGSRNRQFALHMIWYSQNFTPKRYVGEAYGSDLPAARHMRVDEHWVWTVGFGDYLRSLNQHGKIHVVGPILWYLPEPGAPAPRTSIKIAVFDVTPFAAGNNTAFGAARNYYSADTIRQFILDIVRAGDAVSKAIGFPVEVVLKHKRGVSVSRHDATYIGFLETLEAQRESFSLIDHRTDLYQLLEQCDISVSVPYTSTAYVAAHLGKHAVFYDPFSELVPTHEPNEYVIFCAGFHELQETFARILLSPAHNVRVARA